MQPVRGTARDRIGVIVEIGLCVALSVVLGMLKMWQMPQGGEVSLAMLPLLVLAFRRGAGSAVVAGVIYGILDAMMNPFIVHWAQYLLDYPLAYAVVGAAGVFGAKTRGPIPPSAASVVVGTALGAGLRFGVHTLSGIIFFAEYAAPGQPVVLYSAVYNSSVLVSAVACGVIALAVLPTLARVVPVARNASHA